MHFTVQVTDSAAAMILVAEVCAIGAAGPGTLIYTRGGPIYSIDSYAAVVASFTAAVEAAAATPPAPPAPAPDDPQS